MMVYVEKMTCIKCQKSELNYALKKRRIKGRWAGTNHNGSDSKNDDFFDKDWVLSNNI